MVRMDIKSGDNSHVFLDHMKIFTIRLQYYEQKFMKSNYVSDIFVQHLYICTSRQLFFKKDIFCWFC